MLPYSASSPKIVSVLNLATGEPIQKLCWHHPALENDALSSDSIQETVKEKCILEYELKPSKILKVYKKEKILSTRPCYNP